MNSNHITRILIGMGVLACSAAATLAQSDCKEAIARDLVCDAGNTFARTLIESRRLAAVSVVQNARSGALVLFAASDPAVLDISTPLPPLSLCKLFLAAAWWDHDEPDLTFESVNGTENAANPAYRKWVSAHKMLVGGSDSAGIQMAIALRKMVGTDAVLADLHRYGFDDDGPFWADVDSQWKLRLTPPPANASLGNLDDQEWGSALSIGESHMRISALQISRFLQAVGSGGVVCSPVALRRTAASHAVPKSPFAASARILNATTATRLIHAMLDTVARGTANQISGKLRDTGWSIGGKTGTGGVAGASLGQQDEWLQD